MLFTSTRQQTTQPPLQLHLNLSHERTFTTFDQITGSLSLKASRSTPIDGLSIHLHGISRTCGLRFSHDTLSQQRITTLHRFLDLAQPDLNLLLPESRHFDAGSSHEFPFEFTMPGYMLPTQCRHGLDEIPKGCSHTLLPPSFGFQSTDRVNDRTMETAVIEYRVVARVWREVGSEGNERRSVVAECSKVISFMPKRDWSDAGVVCDALTIRKEVGMKYCWSKRTGRLFLSTSTPGASLRLQARYGGSSGGVLVGVAELALHFYPREENAQPPRLGELRTTFNIETCSMSGSAVPGDADPQGQCSSCHTKSVLLSLRPMQHISWTRHCAMKNETSQTSVVECYSAQISVPIIVTDQSLVPPFHSCLVSRTYTVSLRLSFSGGGATNFRNASLELPVVFEWSKQRPLQAGNFEAGQYNDCHSETLPGLERDGADSLYDKHLQPPAYETFALS